MAGVGRKKAGNEKHHLSSRLPQLFKSELERRKLKGEKIIYADIYEELANYVGCSVNMVLSLRHAKVNPSVTTALKVAEYFGVRIEEIWSTSYNEEYIDDRKKCEEPKCDRTVFAKGLCYKHYIDKGNEEQRQKKIKN